MKNSLVNDLIRVFMISRIILEIIQFFLLCNFFKWKNEKMTRENLIVESWNCSMCIAYSFVILALCIVQLALGLVFVTQTWTMIVVIIEITILVIAVFALCKKSASISRKLELLDSLEEQN